MSTDRIDEARQHFQAALTMTTQNLIVDAASAFREVVDRWPDHELADDALYNLGACWLAINQFGRAAEVFREVLKRYPDATIEDSDGAGEQGRTAAKALLGLIAANLGLGDVGQARLAATKLEAYPESFITRPGVTLTFYEIGQSLLMSALEDVEADSDKVTPADVV